MAWAGFEGDLGPNDEYSSSVNRTLRDKVAQLRVYLVAAFQPFEVKAIRLMADAVVPEPLLLRLLAASKADRYEYTGSGYFLTVKDRALPLERRALSEPSVVGVAGEIQAGFVVYLGDGEFTLECHTWGAVDVPENFRELSVNVIA